MFDARITLGKKSFLDPSQGHRRGNQREMGQSLREIAQHLPAAGIELLGKKAQVVRRIGGMAEDAAGLLDLTLGRQTSGPSRALGKIIFTSSVHQVIPWARFFRIIHRQTRSTKQAQSVSIWDISAILYKKDGQGEMAMTKLLESRTLNVSIDRPPARVYDFVSNPETLPLWAKAFCVSVRKPNADWIAETPRGPVKIRFAARNEYGVLDHYLTLASGMEIYVPMRVLANGSGSEVIFTLFQLPETPDKSFADEIELVADDLRSLKDALERG